jgi:hypothetical protein
VDPARIVVLGVGNLIMGDEGLGVRCVERLEAAGALPAGVTVIDGGTSTHELLGDLEDLDLLVIVDAVAGEVPARWSASRAIASRPRCPTSCRRTSTASTICWPTCGSSGGRRAGSSSTA